LAGCDFERTILLLNAGYLCFYQSAIARFAEVFKLLFIVDTISLYDKHVAETTGLEATSSYYNQRSCVHG